MDSTGRPQPHARPRTLRTRHRDPGQRRYSSSDNEEERPGCDERRALNGGGLMHDSLHANTHLGLTADEHHISPIENLDNTINRLYSYLSGSDGEGEPDHPQDQRHHDQHRHHHHNHQHHHHQQPHQHHHHYHPGSVPAAGTVWDRPPSPRGSSQGSSSPCSSLSPSPCDSDVEHDRTVDTMDSGATGENHYSRIHDNSTLPLPSIPPPPLDEPPGPEVPPRRNLRRLTPAQTQTMLDESRGRPYTDGESDFEPQFLVQTASGNVFVPPGSSPPMSPPLPFPRTVPRTSSLPQQVQPLVPQQPLRTPTPDAMLHSKSPYLPEIPPVPTNEPLPLHQLLQQHQHNQQNQHNQQAQGVQQSCSTDRFSSSYRVTKTLKQKCSWRCVALVLLLLTVVLTAVVAYFLAMKMYNLTWRLEEHNDLNTSATNWPLITSPGKGALLPTTASVIVVQYPLGKRMEQTIPPGEYWRTQFYMPSSQFIKFNLSVPLYAVVGVYGRRNVQPSHAQYDFFHIADGSLITSDERQSTRRRRSITAGADGELSTESVFMHYMDAGLWYVFLFNDKDEAQRVSFVGTRTDVKMDCPNQCRGRGECEHGTCSCFPGYTGWDCGQSVCPVLCQGNGIYVRGECQCYNDWKGKECELPVDACHDPTCSNNGKCVAGTCVCSPGFTGQDCQEVACLPPDCSGHGVCVEGACKCYQGYGGSSCSLATVATGNDTFCSLISNCSDHGVYMSESDICQCERGWKGDICHVEVCELECIHGACQDQRCDCIKGWTGSSCDQLECDERCHHHGFCNNGSCVCKQGWNGRHCSLDGCPNSCNGHGTCQLFHNGWSCSCNDGWKGKACHIAMETECDDSEDEDNDGLVDCEDPDCCVSIACKEHMYCQTSPDPMEILLRKQPPSSTASFYDRMRFLVEDNSVQNYATLTSFNQSQVSVIRGKVVSKDGSPLIGIRVSVVTQPLYGFTLTRELGLFDMLVNGGGSVTLQFQRRPFQTKQTTVMVPWNRMVTMEMVTLTLADEELDPEATCDDVSHDHYVMRPIVLSTWQHTQLGACPAHSTIIPESQVLQESLQVPGTDVYLVYHSSESPGYMSTIMIQLTPDKVPSELLSVHLHVAVEGLIFERMFEADPGIKYKFAWDRRNAYNQKVYGIVTASVGVGYEYHDCGRIFWEMQSATMSGYDITSSEIGGWNLHIHHTYNFQEGILHKGDGTNIYLKERPRKVVTVLGNGKARKINCRTCDGTSDNSRLLSPVALASGRDGSLYVGDFNYIRKLSASREDVTTILEFDMPEMYKYFMTVSPLDGKLYLSDYHRRQILRVKTMGAVRDLMSNFEIVAGTGKQCTPGDRQHCGDGGLATEAKLYYPKGIAINKDGIVYFADGANIRTIDSSDVVTTLIGEQGHPTQWSPLPCDRVVSTQEAKLLSPTALAINPLDDTLHILDNNMVLKVTKDNKILIIAGRPLHCPPKNPHLSTLLTEEQAGPRLATDVTLQHPQHISFAQNGDLYIIETDGHTLNQVRVVNTDGTISHYMGAKSPCDCQLEECDCYSPREVLATKVLLHNPTAVTVTPDNVLHVADMGNLRLHSVVATLPLPDRYGQYQVLYPQTQELYVFNRYGQHIATKNLVTDQYTYNFTYNVNSYYGKLVRVTDSGSNQLSIRRDYTTHAQEILPPGGQKCTFIMDNMGQLHTFVAADNATTKFTYLSNTGLLETKETSQGLTFLYEYDQNGRLSNVVQPTGERTLVRTDVDPTGNATTKVSYLHDGALVVEYPFSMAVTMETSPHPLLSTEHQLHVRRKIILPDGLIHRLEWRYYLRRDRPRSSSEVDSVGRRMRVGKPAARHEARVRYGETFLHESPDTADGTASVPAQAGYEGKLLMINGINLLTFEYNRQTHSEYVFNSDMDQILMISYNTAGQPLSFLPSGPVQGLNVTYDDKGHVTQWTRGELSITSVRDEQSGHITEKRIGTRANYRYLYKAGNKPSDVILPSGKQYQLHYDVYGNMKSVVMPSQGRHRFHALTSMGLHRQLYTPPGAYSAFLRDYDSGGKLLQVLYPSRERRVSYTYTVFGKPLQLLHDWSQLRYTYHNSTDMLRSMNLTDPAAHNYTCSMTFEPGNALVQTHRVLLNGTDLGLVSGQFSYQYDKYLRIIWVEAHIGKIAIQPVNISYNTVNGKLERIRGFNFEYPRVHQNKIHDANMEIIQESDIYGRLTDIWYRFNNHAVFTLEIKYDARNRVYQWRRKVGSSDLKAYEYLYDIDGNLLEVILNGRTTWKYEMDANSNIKKCVHHDKVTEFEINLNNQISSCGDVVYHFDEDGFLVKIDSQVFEYNSLGQLVHAFELGKYDVYYFYDAYGRLTARRDTIGGYLTQFFYSDLQNRRRITHVYDHTNNELTSLYYDSRNRLFAMELGSNLYYIALDPIGSPIVIFNSMGSVVKQMAYNPLGQKISDSSPEFSFMMGYKCGIMDHITKFIHLDGRVYDPEVGRWTSPDYTHLLEKISEVTNTPEMVNFYRPEYLVSPQLNHGSDLMLDVGSWMDALGYDINSLIPSVQFDGQLQSTASPPPHQDRLIPVTSAFECAFRRDMHNFVELSTVPRSKVTTSGDEAIIRSFSPFRYIFGEGVVLSVAEGRVVVDVLDSADQVLAALATVLLNNTHVVDAHMTLHGRDVHYFVKESLAQAVEDVRTLSLRENQVVHGLNITVHRHHLTPDVMRYVDIRLHGNHTVLNVRYGSNSVEEWARVMDHAKERALEAAWKMEQSRVQAGMYTATNWSKRQRSLLLSKGVVPGMVGQYIRDVFIYPQLADDPKNVIFVPES